MELENKKFEELTHQKITPQEIKLEIKSNITLEKFKYAYEFIQKRFNLKHSIKPCLSSLLVYGVKDNWKVLLYPLAYEVLRVVDWDKEKALEILSMYLENSEKKSGRTLNRLKSQIDYTIRKKDKIKISCEYLMNRVDCINKEDCLLIRGFKKKRCKMRRVEENNDYVRAQISAYLLRLIESGLDKKLSPEAFKIYSYLVELRFLRGYEWIFVSYRDLYNILKRKTNNLRLFLNELKDNALIVYNIEKPSFLEKKAIEIRVLNLFKEPQERIEEILN